jgi:L-alanine-DL-glutamate epimerase-like enolase superfamily enzyme
MVDANNAWNDLPSALETIRAIEPYGIYWVEEPALPDALELSARIARAVNIPIATGEIESTLWGFQQLVDYRAADILQPDVTVVGGITEFMRVADMAAGRNLPIAPHYFWDVHAHLAATLPNALFVEYFVHDDVVNFDLVLKNPMEGRDGKLVLPKSPGLGIELDEREVAQYALAQ